MKKYIIMLGLVFLCASCATESSDRQPMDDYISDLMDRMTLEEKLGQLNLPSAGDFTTGMAKNSDIAGKIRQGLVGGLFNIKGVDKIREMQTIAVKNSRLGIPLLFGMDVIHGYETIFPIPLALASTWDMDLVERSARIAAVEASASGICWTFSPMVDISRDPRWGRVAEGVGEDPCLASAVSKAFVYGYQGRDPEHYATDEIMGCVKHFALYGAPEAGRDYNTVDMSPQRMYNEYFPPYKAAVEAGVGSVMASFNEINGIPATANKWLMTDVLRKQWGFDGFVVTDYTGIKEMVDHGIGDFKTVSARSMEAGVDMDMVSEGFVGTLGEALAKGRVSQESIDRACRLVLEAKYKLGLFDDPYRYCKVDPDHSPVFSEEHLAQARRIAAESFVLLKNEGGLLPLKRGGTIGVVGPLAASRNNMSGTWCVAADMSKPKTVLEGIREAVGEQARVLYARGSNVTFDEALEKNITMFGREIPRDGRSDRAMLQEALSVAERSDVVVAVLGETAERSGECSSCTYIGIPDAQQTLLKALVATGKPVVLVLLAGRPMTLAWEAEHVTSILNVWFGGTCTASAIGDVLFGAVNPSGKLASSFPRNVGQIPIYYNHKNTGRPHRGDTFQKFQSNYLDVATTPLYPFGYGLSYTTFEYGEVRLSKQTLESEDDRLTASVTVRNTGKCAGKEVVQMYIRDLAGTMTRPVKELKGFRKISLEAGETREVSFEIDVPMLKYYDYDLNFVAEKGDFEVMIGGSSEVSEGQLFTLK